MGLFDFLSIPLLLSLGITILLLTVAGIYFLTKLNDQNHKITSMVELVSTMAQEINNLRYQEKMPITASSNGMYKIDVSDNEDEDEDENEDEDEDEDENEDEEEDEDEDEDEDEINEDLEIEELEDDEDEASGYHLDKEISLTEENPDIKIIHMSQEEQEEEEEEDGGNDDTKIGGNALFDYKKLSVSKLRSLVHEKGLQDDVSKWNKGKLLKWLGVLPE